MTFLYEVFCILQYLGFLSFLSLETPNSICERNIFKSFQKFLSIFGMIFRNFWINPQKISSSKTIFVCFSIIFTSSTIQAFLSFYK